MREISVLRLLYMCLSLSLSLSIYLCTCVCLYVTLCRIPSDVRKREVKKKEVRVYLRGRKWGLGGIRGADERKRQGSLDGG